MNLRAKLFPALFAACVALLALVSVAQYRRAARAAEESLRADTAWRAARLARGIEAELRERADDLARQAAAPAWGELYRAASPAGRVPPPPATDGARARVGDFFAAQRGLCAALTFVRGAEGRPLARFEPSQSEAAGVRVVAGELLPAHVEAGGRGLATDQSQGLATDQSKPRAALARTGAVVINAPVAVGGAENPTTFAALALELKTDALVARAAEGLVGDAGVPRDAFALDRAGRLLYHSNPALKFRNATEATPQLAALAAEMDAGRAGARPFDGADGALWLAAYEPVKGLDLSVAVAANETAATAELRRAGKAYVALALLVACAAVGLVLVRERRAARRIERVARAAQAVAAGNLDERLDVSAHDRTRTIAESFNLMTDRLREHLRRESENQQFQAFMRLSAMLTHDLKNAITGLSMLVSNMERQFHREEFRADAVTSLREATDKLRGLVARLNKPVETLSGEYRSALRPTDLVPLIRRVVEEARVRSQFHEIEARLPDSLAATVDAERVERVVENLVINGLEAMGKNEGRLTVEAGQEGEDQIFLAVADTGPGMSQEFIRARLFQPFSTTKTQGLGLGLYTCREVVQAHGGRIEVESRRSSGTRFRVVLPSRPVSLPRATNSGSVKN
ncbi:MAG TPA: ATP-binding protein [Pyrinomonadaceae bacterium]|jgi:signal transduction histidine kinase|nr:ATP-binding protein [Pyrinomonadaceae bacterium]